MYTQNFMIEIRRKTFYILKDVRNEETIEVETYIIEKIAYLTEENKDSIAILLAQIYSIQKNTHLVKREELVIKEESLIHSLQGLLLQYQAETLAELFEDMKYFEIRQILESDYPIAELRRRI